MHDPMIPTLVRLLKESLKQWQLAGNVRQEPADAITLNSGNIEISIVRATAPMPFRWVLSIGGRKRTAASVGGVIRIVRQTLAPGYTPFTLRIAPAPAVPLPLDPRDTP